MRRLTTWTNGATGPRVRASGEHWTCPNRGVASKMGSFAEPSRGRTTRGGQSQAVSGAFGGFIGGNSLDSKAAVAPSHCKDCQSRPTPPVPGPREAPRNRTGKHAVLDCIVSVFQLPPAPAPSSRRSHTGERGVRTAFPRLATHSLAPSCTATAGSVGFSLPFPQQRCSNLPISLLLVGQQPTTRSHPPGLQPQLDQVIAQSFVPAPSLRPIVAVAVAVSVVVIVEIFRCRPLTTSRFFLFPAIPSTSSIAAHLPGDQLPCRPSIEHPFLNYPHHRPLRSRRRIGILSFPSLSPYNHHHNHRTIHIPPAPSLGLARPAPVHR